MSQITICAVAFIGFTARPATAAAQGKVIDEATLMVHQGSALIGREELRVREGRPSEAGVGYLDTGFTLSATAYYPPNRSYATATSVIQFDADSQPARARMDLDGSGQPNVFVDFTARRVTVRNRTSTGESAGQYPRPSRMLVVDEALLSTFAVLPGTNPGNVMLLFPRSGRRGRAALEDHGIETTSVAGREHRLRHWTLGSGELLRHLWYDALGRLMKIEVPSASLTASRMPRD